MCKCTLYPEKSLTMSVAGVKYLCQVCHIYLNLDKKDKSK